MRRRRRICCAARGTTSCCEVSHIASRMGEIVVGHGYARISEILKGGPALSV